MRTDLAVIIPTRGRPDNIRKVLSAWDFTNAWDLADMVLAVDADDPEIEGYRAIWQEMDDILPEGGSHPIRMITFPEWQPMVHKLNAVAATLADESEHFALGFAGDDHLPQTINWARTYLAELKTLGTGMVYGDDGYQGKNLSTEWAVTTDAVVALGNRMIPADVEHMYCDNAIMGLFEAAGALKYLPAVRIEHIHPSAGKAETDAQYQRVNSREQFRKDRLAYESWKSGQMSADLAKIKALRPARTVRTPTRQRSGPTMSRYPFPRFFKQVKGVTPDDVALTLADLAIGVPADQEIVELGVYHAKTTLILAWGASQGNGAHVTGIDPWDLDGNVYGDEMGSMVDARSWAGHWIRSLGYSDKVALIQAFSHDAAASWPRQEDTHDEIKKIGLLFIDGDHTEQGARRDVLIWAPRLAPGATIAVDDYVNPNYPGVAAAIDALVADGTLDPVTVYHDRLGVTKLKVSGADVPRPAVGWGDPESDPLADTVRVTEQMTAITSEGVSPSPYPAVSGQVAVPYEATDSNVLHPGTFEVTRDELEAEWDRTYQATESSVLQPIDLGHPDDGVSRRGYVQPNELVDAEDATPIEYLTLPQLKALAKARGIVLGIRKDKKSEILTALREGK